MTDETNTLTALRLSAGLGIRPGDVFTVAFALGEALVKTLDWHYTYRDGETVWHVEDVDTGHQDFVGVRYLTPNKK